MEKTDRLGRATFHHIRPCSDVRPTARETRWLEHILRHGPQPSSYLLALTADTHRCRDTGLRQLQKLRAGGYLALPVQQRATEHAEFNPYVYDLTERGRDHLVDVGIGIESLRPTGHWWHAQTVSCVTSAIEIVGRQRGIGYIPGGTILARAGTKVAIPLAGGTLIPDQLFALDYGGTYRVCALEVDRGTEPKTSAAARKSYQRSIALYQELIEFERYKAHYGLKSSLLVLWVFTRRSNEERFLEMIGSGGSLARSVLTRSLTKSRHVDLLRALDASLLNDPWLRAAGGPIHLGVA